MNDKKALARYANDARGLERVKDINNNAEYVEEGVRVFIEGYQKIFRPVVRYFVGYGPEYWQVIRHNIVSMKKKLCGQMALKVKWKALSLSAKGMNVDKSCQQ